MSLEIAIPRTRRGSRQNVLTSNPAVAAQVLPYQERYQQAVSQFAPVYQQLTQQAKQGSSELNTYLKQQTEQERQAVALAVQALEQKVKHVERDPTYRERRKSQRQVMYQLQDVMDTAQKEMRRFRHDLEDETDLSEEQRTALMEEAQLQLASVVLPPQMQRVVQAIMSTPSCADEEDTEQSVAITEPQQQQQSWAGQPPPQQPGYY